MIAAYLLQYPDEVWYESFNDACREAEGMKGEKYALPLLRFLQFARSKKQLDLAELYVNTFEFAKNANLYLTYYLFKEERERGKALLDLKRKYIMAGFIPSSNELPDFLPAALEFAGASGEIEWLGDYSGPIQDIHEHLSRISSPYSEVLRAVLLILGDAELENSLDKISAGGGSI